MEISIEVVILIFLGILSFAAIYSFLEKKINKRKPRASTIATVVKINDRYSGVITFGRRGGYNASPRYIITFKLENDKTKTFTCPSPKYKWVKVGDKGFLTHQGTQFINFNKK